MPNDSADVATRPPWSAVRAAMKLMTAVADARTKVQAERRFDQLYFRAEKSIAFTNAAYIAAQVLRDRDVLSQGEAAYFFRELFELRSDEYSRNDAHHQAHLNAFEKETIERRSAADSKARVDHLLRELTARTYVLEARFPSRAREVGFAELLLRDPEAATNFAVDGECSLMFDKLGTDEPEVGEPDPVVVATICERIAALAASDTTRDTIARYDALGAALGAADVASGMAAVRELRTIGLVSFTESVSVLSDVLDPLVNAEIEADRECAHLEARIAELSRGRPQDSGRRPTTGKTGRVERALQKRLEARGDLLIAMCLRRFGEHEAATLLIENPKEWERLVGLMSLGGWDTPTFQEWSRGQGG